MNAVTDTAHREAAGRVRELMAKYAEIELLIKIGEYKPGSDPVTDEAVRKWDRITRFLRQRTDEASPFQDTVRQLAELAA
jgi:type III secretion protein N (ATPase)